MVATGRWRQVCYDLSTSSSMRWSVIGRTRVWPDARWGHTMTPISPHQLLLIGGSRGSQDTSLTEHTLFVLDTRTWSWQIHRTSGNAPPARQCHTCVRHGDEVIVFGGMKPRGIHRTVSVPITGDVYCLNVKEWTWRRVPPVGDAPPKGLTSHTAVVCEDVLYVFGGYNTSVASSVTHQTLWTLDLTTWVWATPTVSGTPPAHRFVHAMIATGPHDLLVFGGRTLDVNVKFSDVFKLNTRTLVWSEETAIGGSAGPLPRGGCAMALWGNKVAIIGGAGVRTGCFADGIHTLRLPSEGGGARWSVIRPRRIGNQAQALPPMTCFPFVPTTGAMVIFGGCSFVDGVQSERANAVLRVLHLVRPAPAPALIE